MTGRLFPTEALLSWLQSGYNMATSGKVQDDDDVPPLEDMSETLQKISEMKAKQKASQLSGDLPKREYLEATEDLEEAKFKSVNKLLQKDDGKKKFKNPPSSEEISSVSRNKKQQEGKTQSNNFGGFKKGFLLSNPKVTKSQTGGGQATSSTNSSSEKIEEITRRDPSQAKDPLVFSEVQAALEAQMPLLKSKEWITEDLLSKVQKNPKLMKQLDDPHFSKVLTEFQKNPQQAMAAVRNDPEAKEFIQEFCGLLGNHFTALGEADAKKNTPQHIETLEASSSRRFAPHGKDPPTRDEHERFQKIISDPEVKDILADEKIQHLIGVLKDNPADAQRVLAELGPQYHSKIQKLIEAGLLGVTRK